MKYRFKGSLFLFFAFAFALMMPSLVQAAGANELSLDEVNYLHRWSKNGQNEFTPPAEDDLSRWNDMITINVADKVTDGDKLAELANRILSGYQTAGKVLRTDSRPRTEPVRPSTSLVPFWEPRNFLRQCLHDLC